MGFQPSEISCEFAEELAALESALLAAHACKDHDVLVALYQRAGQLKEMVGDIDAACFYFTHAYVYALETGNQAARQLCSLLAGYGREAEETV